MYNSTGADRQQHANNGDNRNSDMSAYEDDYAHQQQGNSNLNPGSARYSDYGTPTGGLDSRRDSYNADPASSGASPQMNEDLRKYHSQGGAYTNLGNEPSSPIMGHHHPQHQQASSSSRNQDDGDGDSNGDSSSNGSTKVDSRSPSAYRVRGAGAAGGQGYGMGGDSQAHGSEVRICPSLLPFCLLPLASSAFNVARALSLVSKARTPAHICDKHLAAALISRHAHSFPSLIIPRPATIDQQADNLLLSHSITCSPTLATNTPTEVYTPLEQPTTRPDTSMPLSTTLLPLHPPNRTTPMADSEQAHTLVSTLVGQAALALMTVSTATSHTIRLERH